jgi:beta-lactamase family protein
MSKQTLLAVVLAALLTPAVARTEELRTPREAEAFFGAVRAGVPQGATEAVLFVGNRRAATAAVTGRVAAFRLGGLAGPRDVRIRFEREGRLIRRDESRRVWFLPATAGEARRERVQDQVLSGRLAVRGRNFPGYAALWVHELHSGRTAGWNSDASFPAASTVKLGVLIAALRQFGPRPERSVAWPEIRDLAVWSSNDASNRLLVRLGGSEAAGTAIVQATLQRVGARSSTFTGNYRLGTSASTDTPRPLPLVSYRRTTAHDLGRILFELHAAALGNGLSLRRTALSRHEARVGLALLLSSSRRGSNLGLLRPALGRRVPMAQKQGWTRSVRHTAAIVYGRRGPVIVVVLTYRPRIDSTGPAALARNLVALLRSRGTI